MLVFREHQQLTGLDQTDRADLEKFALANQEDQQGDYRPVLTLRNGQLHTRNYVGVLETRKGTVLEILPKIDFSDGDGDDEDHKKTRKTFLTMLRTYRGLRTAEFNETKIAALRHFHMLDAFVRLFLNDLLLLTKRGLARHYQGVEDNLPRLRGRIQFPQHIRHNAANRARFYVAFDEFTADRPVNRLIHSTIHKLRSSTHPSNQQLLHQLRISFSEVPRSTRPEVDWQRHRVDRSMRHYDAVMAWVGLFLFDHGLATFAGKKHINHALLFPMEEVFEDFVTDAFQRYQRDYRVKPQGPQQAFTIIDGKTAFCLKPDISLLRSGKVQFVLDAKWKEINGQNTDLKHGINQNDIYQLYSYGRGFDCGTVVLIYPQTRQFQSHLRYRFTDAITDRPLTLLCFPFDVTKPKDSVREIAHELTD